MILCFGNQQSFNILITFTVSIFTGMLAATGMVLHEFPEGIITYLLLLRGGFSEKNP
jgi:zinc transporter ZupT